jgi:glucosamine kinase
LRAEHPDAPIHFAGSVASNFQDYLAEAAEERDIKIAGIIKEPINNLLTYYSNKN